MTGTNGKGSTSAMVTALLMAKGLSVGTYTSPNLHVVAERLARNAQPIDDESLTGVLTELALLEPLLDERPTRFELLTAAALAWFATEAVDAMVVEVGLGGTWDCTNVVHGDVAVLTNVSFDHTDVLGPTLEGIAADKAGHHRAGEPGRGGGDWPRAGGHRGGAGRRRSGPARSGSPGGTSAAGRTGSPSAAAWSTLWTPGGRYEDVLVPLHGAHQGENAAWPLAAAEAFFGDPLTPRWWRRASPRCACPGGSRCWAGARCCWSTARTTRRAWRPSARR